VVARLVLERRLGQLLAGTVKHDGARGLNHRVIPDDSMLPEWISRNVSSASQTLAKAPKRWFDKVIAAIKDEKRRPNMREVYLEARRQVAIADAVEAYERKAAKERQKEHGGTAPGKRKNTSAESTPVSETRQSVAKSAGTSHFTLARARAVVEAAQAEPDKYQALLEEMDRTGRVNGVYRKLVSKQSSPASPFKTPRFSSRMKFGPPSNSWPSRRSSEYGGGQRSIPAIPA
jgi:hypothetical protein